MLENKQYYKDLFSTALVTEERNVNIVMCCFIMIRSLYDGGAIRIRNSDCSILNVESTIFDNCVSRSLDLETSG